MRVFLQTRGRTADYRFLGQSPTEHWWLEFASFTRFEKPTVLVTSSGTQWKAYLSGLPSARSDRVNTPIRFSIVLDGTAPDKDVGNAIKLVAAWVANAACPGKPSRLQEALDTALPESVVESLLADRTSDAAEKKVDERVRDALSRLDAVSRLEEASSERDIAGAWVGRIQAESCRTAFLGRVAKLLKGAVGAAFMVNLVGDDKEAEAIIEKHPGAAVLLLDPASSFDAEGVMPLEKKKITYTSEGGSKGSFVWVNQIAAAFLKVLSVFSSFGGVGSPLHTSILRRRAGNPRWALSALLILCALGLVAWGLYYGGSLIRHNAR